MFSDLTTLQYIPTLRCCLQFELSFFQGGMEDFFKYMGISRTLCLIYCMFWMFSPAGKNNLQTCYCDNEYKLEAEFALGEVCSF